MNRIADRDYEFYDFNDDSDHEPCSRFDNITNNMSRCRCRHCLISLRLGFRRNFLSVLHRMKNRQKISYDEEQTENFFGILILTRLGTAYREDGSI